MCVARAPSSLRSLQTKFKKDVKISYSAHIESHKKFETLNIDKEKTFKPKILNTPASSKLIQSRNYQPPKKTHQKLRIVHIHIIKIIKPHCKNNVFLEFGKFRSCVRKV
jgi:hypothetical protein